MILVLSGVFIIPSIYYCLLIAPVESKIGEFYRIIYFHIPAAWLCVVAFLVSFVASILFLSKSKQIYDAIAAKSAEIGLLFALLATIMGSIFASLTWGSPWNWDPREVSIVVLMMIYVAYIVLRSSIQNSDRRGKVSAGYSIIAFMAVPFLVFIMPRITPSLHPENIGSGTLPLTMLLGVLGMVVGFTLLFIQILKTAVKIDLEGR